MSLESKLEDAATRAAASVIEYIDHGNASDAKDAAEAARELVTALAALSHAKYNNDSFMSSFVAATAAAASV